MPTLATNSIILDSVMNELRMPVSNLTERAKIQRVVNGVYADICAKNDWWWLIKKTAGVLVGVGADAGTGNTTITGSFVDGNVGITASCALLSPTVTLSSAPVNTYLTPSAAIWFEDGSPDAGSVYRVSSTGVSAAGVLTLDGFFGGDPGSGIPFRLYRDIFPASLTPVDMAKILRVTRYGMTEDMKKIGFEEMSQMKQWDKSVGRPLYWTVWDFDTSGDPSTTRNIWVHPYPDANYRIEVWYKHANTQDTSVDLSLPMDYQQVLIYGALARGYPIFLNDLDRGSYYQSLFNDVIALMVNQQREYASDKPGIQTDMRQYRHGSQRSRWPGRSLGRYFDTLPYQP